MQRSAAVADAHAEPHDRVAVNARQPFSRSDRATFCESGDDGDLFVARENVHGGNP
jgi:hypothetical protein